MTLASRVALITGAGSGIGRAIALAFAAEGAQIVAVARTAEAIESTAAATRALGVRALALPLDVRDRAAVDAGIEAALRAVGRIDVLVNAAGTYGPIGPLERCDPEAWVDTVATNLIGVFHCCRAVLPAMIERGSGAIVNFGGGGATSPRRNFSAYSASKTAVVRLTETLAHEVAAAGVRVNAIAPGAIDTAIHDDVLAAGDAAGEDELALARKVKAGGGASMEAVTALALFLAGDASRGITGRLLSAVWDNWRAMPGASAEIAASDWYTLRRVVPPRDGATS